MNNPWSIEIWEILVRLGLALLLGGLIGLEREQSNRAAGFRTNILVCVGSALIMLLSMYGFTEFVGHTQLDPARLAAQVVSGIGFLGAGVILFNGFSVTGLTTAATLWVVAGIGLAAGAGFYIPAAAATAMVLFSLHMLNKVEEKWLRAKSIFIIQIKMDDRPSALGEISELLRQRKIDLKRITVERLRIEDPNRPEPVRITIHIKLKQKLIVALIEQLRRVPGVFDVTVE